MFGLKLFFPMSLNRFNYYEVTKCKSQAKPYRDKFYSAQNNAEKVEVIKELFSLVSGENEPKEEAVSRQPTSDFYTVRQKARAVKNSMIRRLT